MGIPRLCTFGGLGGPRRRAALSCSHRWLMIRPLDPDLYSEEEAVEERARLFRLIEELVPGSRLPMNGCSKRRARRSIALPAGIHRRYLIRFAAVAQSP